MSLNFRINLSATLLLLVFISLTAFALDRAFFESTESALRDKLTSQLYALMAAAEIDDQQIIMPSSELDALLGLPSSGVYAYITDSHEQIQWQSSSVLSATPPKPFSLNGGEKRFVKSSINDNDFYSLAYGINWATGSENLALTFNISSDLESFNRQIQHYRTTLLGWLLAMAFLLLLSQALILRWGLFPLRRVGQELNRIETGEQQSIVEHYPLEINRLTQNINLLLQQERDQKTRYRNALGDLAHSLKTPLAVLQSGLRDSTDASLQQQIERMNSIVEYQLQRAATAGSTSIGKSVNVRHTVERILESLKKVYQEKNINTEISIADEIKFRGDEGDLMELLGNLLDNAFKWAQQSIQISAIMKNSQLQLCVSDDGPGIAADQVELLLQRGIRADQGVAGHGIGLSIIGNIVDAYKGQLEISKSQLGGAEVRIII